MSAHSVILQVDDDENDRFLWSRLCVSAKVLNPIVAVGSGEEAMDYLSGKGKYSNRADFPLPGLILLDLKMSGVDGFTVLRWIRAQPGISTLRVVVLTGSTLTRDIDTAYRLGANSFLTKPNDFERFLEIANALNNYWLRVDKMPTSWRPWPPSSPDRPSPRPRPNH